MKLESIVQSIAVFIGGLNPTTIKGFIRRYCEDQQAGTTIGFQDIKKIASTRVELNNNESQFYLWVYFNFFVPGIPARGQLVQFETGNCELLKIPNQNYCAIVIDSESKPIGIIRYCLTDEHYKRALSDLLEVRSLQITAVNHIKSYDPSIPKVTELKVKYYVYGDDIMLPDRISVKYFPLTDAIKFMMEGDDSTTESGLITEQPF